MARERRAVPHPGPHVPTPGTIAWIGMEWDSDSSLAPQAQLKARVES